jgi:4-hydroxy-tetrahydrodipicolinate synthase
MTMMQPLAGLWPPVATPFGPDGRVDEARLVKHSRTLLADGAHGLAILGTTSEANSLSLPERRGVIDAHVADGIDAGQLMPGTGACSIEDAITLTRHAGGIGTAGVLLLPPFYYKNATDEGLYAFVSTVIERVGDKTPRIMLYHIPHMASLGWSLELIDRLRTAFPGIVAGIKDSTGNEAHTASLIDAFPDDFAVFPGAEVYLLNALRRGAAGCISASANINAHGIRELLDRWRDPDAEALQAELITVRKAVESRGMIPALKAVLAERYRDPAWLAVRPPLLPITDQARAELLADPVILRLLDAVAA